MSTLVRWKVTAILFALCCIVLVYRIFDQGITRTYLDASQETSAMHIKLLTSLVEHEWLGLSEEDVILRLKAYINSQPPNSLVLKREPETNTIYLEDVRFYFHERKLVKVM